MKKKYIEPETKVVEVKAGKIICGSQLDVYLGQDPGDWNVEKFGW